MKDRMKDLSDHDLLIRLDTKVDSLAVAMKEMRDGTTARIENHELRLRTMEEVADKSDTFVRLKQIDELMEFKHDFKLTVKTLVGISSSIGAVVGFVLAVIAGILNIIRL